MDLYEDLTVIWVDVLCSFLMLSFLFFVVWLIWQHLKNKRDQEAITSQYNQNLKILLNLKSRF